MKQSHSQRMRKVGPRSPDEINGPSRVSYQIAPSRLPANTGMVRVIASAHIDRQGHRPLSTPLKPCDRPATATQLYQVKPNMVSY